MCGPLQALQAGPDCRPVLILHLHPPSRRALPWAEGTSRVKFLPVTVMMTWALHMSRLSLIPRAIMAMSVRILFTSHDRYWSVGSLPYLLEGR